MPRVGSVRWTDPQDVRDVLPPKQPLGTLFNAETSPGSREVQILTVNSLPVGTNGTGDSSLRTTPGYDNVTGLGTPNVPAVVGAFTNLP